jgi:hypothetical protein
VSPARSLAREGRIVDGVVGGAVVVPGRVLDEEHEALIDFDHMLHEIVATPASVVTRNSTPFAAADALEVEGAVECGRDIQLGSEAVERPHNTQGRALTLKAREVTTLRKGV